MLIDTGEVSMMLVRWCWSHDDFVWVFFGEYYVFAKLGSDVD